MLILVALKMKFCSCLRFIALAVLQTSLLLMKSLNKTDTSIFYMLCVLCSISQSLIFLLQQENICT